MTAQIRSVQAIPLRYSLGANPYGSSRGLVAARQTTLVRLETSDGVVGWGESFGPTLALVPLIQEVSAALPGAALEAPSPFVAAQLQQHYHRGGGLHAAAVSGVEVAIWDALGRTLGVTVATLLGGRTRDTLTPYASCGYAREHRALELFPQGPRQERQGTAAEKSKGGFVAREARLGAGPARPFTGPGATLMEDPNATTLPTRPGGLLKRWPTQTS